MVVTARPIRFSEKLIIYSCFMYSILTPTIKFDCHMHVCVLSELCTYKTRYSIQAIRRTYVAVVTIHQNGLVFTSPLRVKVDIVAQSGRRCSYTSHFSMIPIDLVVTTMAQYLDVSTVVFVLCRPMINQQVTNNE